MDKRITALMMAALVFLSAAGCGKTAGGTTEGPATEARASSSETESGKETEETGFEGQTVSLFLVQDEDIGHEAVLAQIHRFEEINGCTVIWETDTPEDGRRQIRTRLAAGTMTDVFTYDTGSRLAALGPEDVMVPLESEPWIGQVTEGYRSVQEAACGGHVYLVPAAPADALGVFYSRPIFERLGVSVPETWYEFLAACSMFRSQGLIPVAQGYGEPSRTTVLLEASWYYIHHEVPDYAEKVLAREMELDGAEALRAGLEKLPAMEPYLNRHWLTATEEECVRRLGNGEAAMMIGRTDILAEMNEISPEYLEILGFFPLPDNSPYVRGITCRMPVGYGISKGADNLPLALELVRFFGTQEASEIYAENTFVTGVFQLADLEPEALAALPAVRDAQMWAKGSLPDLDYFCPVRAADTLAVTERLFRYEYGAEEAVRLLKEGFAADAAAKGIPGWE